MSIEEEVRLWKSTRKPLKNNSKRSPSGWKPLKGKMPGLKVESTRM
jgi:hypothetical protein